MIETGIQLWNEVNPWRRRLAGAAVVVMAGLPGACAPRVAAQAPQSSPPAVELLYVAIQDEAKIAVVDMATREVRRTIDLTALGFSPNAKPHHIVVEPDGSAFYVSLIGDNAVVKFERDGSVLARHTTETPGMLALHPTEPLLLMSRSMSAVNPPPRIGIVSRTDLRGEEIDVFFPRPHPMVVAPGGIAYTGSLGVNQLAAVDIAAQRVELTDIPGSPHALVQYALSPNGQSLVASTELSGRLLVFDLAMPMKPRLVREVAVGPMAFDPVFSPDGRQVWVPVKGANAVAVIETTGWTVVDRIEHPALRQPHQIVFSADGSTAFVSNNNKADHMAGHEAHGGPDPAAVGSLVVIDAASRDVVRAIELGRNLTGMGARARR